MVTVRANRKIAISSSVVAGKLKKRTMASDTAMPMTPPEDSPSPNTEYSDNRLVAESRISRKPPKRTMNNGQCRSSDWLRRRISMTA